MHDDPIFSAPLAPHTADIAKLCAADHLDVAQRVHEAALGQISEPDHWMAGVLLDAPWEEIAPEFVGPGTSAQHTSDAAEMIAAGHGLNAARSMHIAYYTAELEREDAGSGQANVVDIWMAGVLLEATWEQARAVGALAR